MIRWGFRYTSPPRRRLSRLLPTIPCLLGCLCLGCGTAEYERRLSESVKADRASQAARANFSELYAPQALTGTAVSVRLPTVFKDPPLVEGAVVDGAPVDVRRVKPGTVELPALNLTYEGFVKDVEGGSLPYYCYVGAVATAEQPLPNFTDPLRKELKTDWTNFPAHSPDGRAIEWQKMRVVGPQEFYYRDKAGQEQFTSLPGVLEIYVREEAGFLVVVAWRMPASIEQSAGLAKWAPLVAGGVSVKP